MSDYEFMPLEETHLPMMRTWLETPHVREWWGDPVREFDLVAGDIADTRIEQRLVLYKGTPFAYIQDYDPRDWPDEPFQRLPEGARATDQFIGRLDMLGRGHGPKFMNTRARQLLAEGATLVATDPDCQNLRARRAYAKAGFFEKGKFELEDGCFILMTYPV